MPQFGTGDMWSIYDEAGLFLITTNATIITQGVLVMGRGIARQAQERFPGLNVSLGRQVQVLCTTDCKYRHQAPTTQTSMSSCFRPFTIW
jgi:hypothetical protein